MQCLMDGAHILMQNIRECGYECKVVEKMPSDPCIALGIHEQHVPEPPPGSVIYNTEQHGGHHIDDVYADRLRRFNVWDYSAVNAQVLGHRAVQLWSPHHWGRWHVPTVEKDIDVLFVGNMTDRRREVLAAIQKAGPKVSYGFDLFDSALGLHTGRAKVVLSLNRFEAAIFPSFRIIPALRGRACVVSEASAGLEGASLGVTEVPAEELPALCAELVASEARRQEIIGRAVLTAPPGYREQMTSAIEDWLASLE